MAFVILPSETIAVTAQLNGDPIRPGRAEQGCLRPQPRPLATRIVARVSSSWTRSKKRWDLLTCSGIRNREKNFPEGSKKIFV
jgi:hypothetical protein